VTGKEVSKNVFVIYYQVRASPHPSPPPFQGQSRPGAESFLADKIAKICTSFSCTIFPWPRDSTEAERRMGEIDVTLADKVRAFSAYDQLVRADVAQLLTVAGPEGNGNSLIEEWRQFCVREKNIWHTLNMFEGDGVTLRCDCWFPLQQEDVIRRALLPMNSGQGQVEAQLSDSVQAMLLTDSSHHEDHVPPTYLRSNEFTAIFQEVVDTYGVPRYKEINPALFAIVTFPFIFGVMYGDIGHGFILFLTGLWLITNSDYLKVSEDSTLRSANKCRYILTAMGFFSIYAGLM
jgi:V-type H+-transporting ATPase subunit a